MEYISSIITGISIVIAGLILWLFYGVFINIIVPFLFFYRLLPEIEIKNRYLKVIIDFLIVLVLSIPLIIINVVISFFAMWVLTNILFMNILTTVAVIPIVYLIFKKKYFKAILLAKAVEILVVIIGPMTGMPIN